MSYLELFEIVLANKWAYSKSTKPGTTEFRDDFNLYEEATQEDKNISKMALTEEAQKTREIKTTPMPSYLRQAYLLYRWGKPPLSSSISTDTWTAHFEMTMHTGKCPYIQEKIIHDIETWVSGSREDGKPKYLDKHAVELTLNTIFSQWSDPKKVDGFLTFDEFCNDYNHRSF